MTVYTYLIKSDLDGGFYTGISIDPFKRVNERNSGKLKTTAFKKPWKLVYINQHESYSEAREQERWLKKKNRKYKEALAQLAPPYVGGVK
ncbi:MAG: GIY-YIG nuclease family protein [Candidatus Berkelbacteria bacterium]|nr:GIY-YIG nuclease family protein [Candidatus Berkelbacteria bacterium]